MSEDEMSAGDTSAGTPSSNERRERQRVWAGLVFYAGVLWAAGRWLTVFDDEANIIVTCATPPLEVARTFLAGEGMHRHPPLWDILLHGWIRLTDGAEAWIRVPSVVLSCASLAFVSATSARLWGRRLPALVIAVVWPTGLFYSFSAHWMPLTMLGVSASTWAYFRARESESARDVALFIVFSIVLVYTNYLGAMFIAALGLHLLCTRPSARNIAVAAIAAALIVATATPLWLTFVRVTETAVSLRNLPGTVISASFYSYVLLASETVAPWHIQAAPAALGALLLAYVAVRTRETWWASVPFVLLFVLCVALTLVGSRRGGMFGPWLILILAGLYVHTKQRRLLIGALALIFGTGWLGLAIDRWPATYRYTEPWREVAQKVLSEAKPGDLIVAGHPSFHYYAHYAGDWEGWPGAPAGEPFQENGIAFAALNLADVFAPVHDRITVVRSKPYPPWAEAAGRFDALLASGYRKTHEERYVHDADATFKSRLLLSPQPEWRIRIESYERRQP